MERRLTAILAADVVGYSRLVEADEEATLARFADHLHELIEPTIAARRGGSSRRRATGFWPRSTASSRR